LPPWTEREHAHARNARHLLAARRPAADQPIAACGGDPKEVVKALLVAVDFLEAQVDELRRLSQPAMRAAASTCGATARRS
jgi:hypothetical protein